MWADDWSTVWSADFASAPTGMTYSVTNGSTDISTGVLSYYQGGGSGDRALTTAFTADAFNVTTNWKMEFDWGASSSNKNGSSVVFATDQGTAFTITWASYGSTATITSSSSTELTTSLPIDGYSKATPTKLSHMTITGDTENGIYLTVTYNETTYVDNILVSSTYGYPKTFSGSLGRAVAYMALDNITFATPKVAGFVAAPTGTITAPNGTDRKFTLSCLTDGATIYYAESDLEIGAAGWTEYTSEVTTSAETIYAYASDGVNNSEKISFATGVGTAITLNAPIITLSSIAEISGFYYPIVTIANDQSGLSLVPASSTLSYTLDGSPISESNPYTFTGTGELTVTVSADGFTSNSASYIVNNSFIKTKTIDLAAITVGDLSAVWTKTSDASQLPEDRWINNYNSAEFPLYTYDYTNASASTTDVIDGLVVNISSADADPGVTPTLYVGAGMILPTKKLNASDLSESGTWNTNIGVSVAGGTAEEIAVYTYPTNYGQSTKTSTIAGNETYNLYRYSDMLTKVEVYSPAPASVSATVGTYQWATFVAPYALDFSAVDGLTAYIVTGNTGSAVDAAPVDDVPAGTAVMLNGAAKTYSIPVAASSSTDVSANKLVPGTGAAVEAGTTTTRFALTNDGTKAIFKKIGATAITIPEGKAYLELDGDVSAPILNFFSDPTGINDVKRETITNNGEVYNLNGQRVAQPTKGLYIVNGRKVVIK